MASAAQSHCGPSTGALVHKFSSLAVVKVPYCDVFNLRSHATIGISHISGIFIDGLATVTILRQMGKLHLW